MRITRHTLTSSLRSLPAKTTALAKTGHGCHYAPPLSPLIHQLKFSRRSEIASALSRLLLLEVLHARRTTGLQLPDRIISVPLWQRRHWRRGFNQSDLLCQPLSRWLHCQWDSEAITRYGHRHPAFSQCPATQAQPEKCLSVLIARARSPYGDCG